VKNVEQKCIQNTTKAFMARNTNYRMSSQHDKGPGGLCPVFLHTL
jgi:hypothetical protein